MLLDVSAEGGRQRRDANIVVLQCSCFKDLTHRLYGTCLTGEIGTSFRVLLIGCLKTQNRRSNDSRPRGKSPTHGQR